MWNSSSFLRISHQGDTNLQQGLQGDEHNKDRINFSRSEKNHTHTLIIFPMEADVSMGFLHQDV